MTSRKSGRRTFVRGNERLDKLLARPEIAAGVAEVEVEAREMDRVYAENLAMIRRASDLTQVEVAEKLGVGQAVVSRLERRSDMLLSTLADYLHATGAEHPRIVAVLNGVEVELDLDQFRESRSA
ncbi:helix-turn-helix transcriptional regulator [Kribbella sp. NBC_01510]|uniref:helix-turn-helix domain-containing protein n=1 Tax=Kribbella sp. NBC_01510 TaxID=2903581 RepID=UPI00386D4ADE